MNYIKYYFVTLCLITNLSYADDDPKVNALIDGYFKSKERGDNRWYGNHLSKDAVVKIKRMFEAIKKSGIDKNADFPDFSNMQGGDLYEKLVELARSKNPNMGAAWTGAKFRLIGVLTDNKDTKYAMYEASWHPKNSAPIRKTSYFKMIRDGKEWRIALLGDIDRALDLQIKQLNAKKK